MLRININETGNPVVYTTSSISDTQKFLHAVITTPGKYYFAIAQPQNGDILQYTVSAFEDSDHDGLSDEVEVAIDSNAYNADSDSDLVRDFLEVNGHVLGDVDVDQDGIPNWWDLDSDGDMIADTVEMTNGVIDVDGDGSINSLDLDSDGNGISDTTEFGSDFRTATNTDKDSLADYVDTDNDNDNIDDAADLEPNVKIDPLASETPINIQSITESESDEPVFECRVGQTLKLTLSEDTLSNDAQLIAKPTGNSSKTVIPYTRSGSEFTFDCNDGPKNAAVNLFVTDGRYASTEYAMTFIGDEQLYVSSVTLPSYGSTITLEGYNLDQDFMLVWKDGEVEVNNSGAYSDSYVRVNLPDNFQKGFAYIEYIDGHTSEFYIGYESERIIDVEINEIDGLDRTQLAIGSNPNNEASISSGTSNVKVSKASDDLITLIKVNADGSNNVVGYLPVVPNSDEYVLDSRTTALGLMWNIIDKDWTNSEDATEVLNSILNLPEIITLGNFVYKAIKSDNSYLAAFDLYGTTEYSNGFKAVTEYLASLNDQSLTSQDIQITPSGEVDGFTVKLTDGEVVVKNDTKLVVAFQYTDEEGNELCKYGNSLFSQSFVGPQSTYLYWAGKGTCYEGSFDSYKSGDVRVLTPGFGVDYDADLTPAQINSTEKAIRKMLIARSITESLLMPTVNSALEAAGLTGIKTNKLLTLLNETSWFGTEMAGYAYDADRKALFDSVFRHMLDDILTAGPFSSGMVKLLAPSLDPAVFIKNKAEKMVPVVGQYWKLAELSINVVSTATAIGNYVYDSTHRDTVVDFEVLAPIQVDSVEPATLSEPDAPVKLVVNGLGFNDRKNGIFATPEKPTVTFTDTTTNETKSLKPYHIESDGTSLWVMVDNSFLVKNHKYDVSVVSAEEYAGSSTLEDALEVVDDKVVLTYLERVSGSLSNEYIIHGSGFSHIQLENEILLDDTTEIVVSNSTETTMMIRLPVDLEPDTHAIKAKRISDDNWSNALTIDVSESNITIRVCDSGSAKDDNFALDVDNQRVGQTFTTWSEYCFVFPLTVSEGVHTATLSGLDAPDGVGTYQISFNGASSISGDRTWGSDLEPSTAPKKYQFVVSSNATVSKIISMSTQTVKE